MVVLSEKSSFIFWMVKAEEPYVDMDQEEGDCVYVEILCHQCSTGIDMNMVKHMDLAKLNIPVIPMYTKSHT